MAYARAGSWVVVTNDLDFGLLLAASLDDGPSVVQLRARRTNPDLHGPAMVRAIRWAAPQLERGALLTVDPGRMRVRLLPLRLARLRIRADLFRSGACLFGPCRETRDPNREQTGRHVSFARRFPQLLAAF